MSSPSFDYIVVGAGNAGCVIASRLSQYLPDVRIALCEAGPDAHHDERVVKPSLAPALHRTSLQWNYMTVPQRHLNERRIYHCGGRLLSGSSAVNYGGWSRGARADFDTWSDLAGDTRWSYDHLLKYFKRSECYHANLGGAHGYDGPIHTTPSPEWPLTEQVERAFAEIGTQPKADVNNGDPSGLGRWTHAWHNQERQPAGQAYDLSKVSILTETTVNSLILAEKDEPPVAVGVRLTDGTSVYCRNEVIVCCGAFRSPQLLMLSGIGPADQLLAHSISVQALNEEVGRNLHDHSAVTLYWKLKNPNQGLALGSPTFPQSSINPVDWVFTEEFSNVNANTDRMPRESQNRACSEIVISYSPASAAHLSVPRDGSIMSTGVVCLSPVSRGTVTLASADSNDDPSIDPQYLSAAEDSEMIRKSLRQAMRLMSTDALKNTIQGQWAPPGLELNSDSSDDDLNRRIRATAVHWYHAAGTASMGKVVDAECRVFGVRSLRVCDASVIPTPITGHLQATVYALAEQCAEMIAADNGYKSS